MGWWLGDRTAKYQAAGKVLEKVVILDDTGPGWLPDGHVPELL